MHTNISKSYSVPLCAPGMLDNVVEVENVKPTMEIQMVTVLLMYGQSCVYSSH